MVNPFEETLQAGIAHPNLQPFEPSSPWTPKSNIPGVRQMEINRATREYNEENEPAWYINPSYHTSGPAGMHERMIPDPSERFYNPHADREYSKFQVRANEAREREDIESAYRNLKLVGKNPMFFETMVSPPWMDELFENEEFANDPSFDLMSIPFDADMTPSFDAEDVEYWMNNPILEASAPGFSETELAQSQWKRPENLEKTIQSLELRPEFEGWTHDEIKHWLINQARANRGGIIGLL